MSTTVPRPAGSPPAASASRLPERAPAAPERAPLVPAPDVPAAAGRLPELPLAGAAAARVPRPLSVPRAAAVYIGALLGPGLLLLPGLAVRVAGPAAMLSLAALLVLSLLLAVTFTRLGVLMPSSGGARTYVTRAFGPRMGAAAGWCFLAGVITGAPVVCLIGGAYVADLFGGDPMLATASAIALLGIVVTVTLAGMRSSSGMQLGLVAVVIATIAVAVIGTAGLARAEHWSPFLPSGPAAVGQAAALLMLSFVGWEAAAPLTARLENPTRRLPRVLAIAYVVTAAIFLAIFAAIIGVLGPEHTDVPVSRLLGLALGPAGAAAGVVIAVGLTLGTTNSYLAGATEMLSARVPGGAAARFSPRVLLLSIGAIGLAMLALVHAGWASTETLIAIPTALFLAVYIGCTAAAARIFRRGTRAIAIGALLCTAAILAFCGWAILAPVAVIAAVLLGARRPASGAR